MRLSTSTNIFFNRPEGKKAEIQDSIRLCAAGGYKVMDMNFYDCTTFRLPFTTDGWRPWIDDIKQTADQCGVEFSQSHSNFYNFCDPNAKDKELLDRCVLRSIDCSELLGVKWMVTHAGTDFDSATPVKSSREKNLEYLKPVIEYAAKHNVGVAVENLWEYNIAPLRRYTSTAEELVELVDILARDYDNVGICWDVEHANIMKQSQTENLRMIGDRLKATHISDNIGIQNDHILPFYGYTDWKEIMTVLKEISYQGDFTYEIHRYTTQLPEELVVAALKYSVEVGNYLLNLV